MSDKRPKPIYGEHYERIELYGELAFRNRAPEARLYALRALRTASRWYGFKPPWWQRLRSWGGYQLLRLHVWLRKLRRHP